MFEQAARAPSARTLEGRARADCRASARALQQALCAARAGGGAPVVLQLLLALVEGVEASRRRHWVTKHRAQAHAAADAAGLLREAATVAILTGLCTPTRTGVPGNGTCRSTIGRLCERGPVTALVARLPAQSGTQEW